MLAVGFSLVFGVARILNLSHTAYFMTAAYGIYFFTVRHEVNPFLSILIAITITVLIGLLFYKYFLEPVREHQTAVLIIAIAIALVLQELMLTSFGGHYRGVPSIVRGFFTVLDVRITYQHAVVFLTSVLTLSFLWYVLSRTRLGVAIRASAQDREAANLMGINVRSIALYTMGIGVLLAAIAGAVVAPLYTLEPHMWMHPLIIVLATVILGGLGSLKGSFIGACIIAFVEVTVVFTIPEGQYLRVPVALAIMVGILIVKPEGLFGIHFEGER